MKDWAIRAAKTFVQAFLGVLIPAVVTLLSGGFPESTEIAWTILSPTVSAALAAAICAVWNLTKEKLSPGGEFFIEADDEEILSSRGDFFAGDEDEDKNNVNE